MVSDMYVMVRKMITGVFGSLFDSKKYPQEYHRDEGKVLMKFRPGQLFKGHQGSVCLWGNEIIVHNSYYSGTSHQRIDRDGISLVLQNDINHPKWLGEKLNDVSTLLKHLQYENMPPRYMEFMLIDKNDKYLLNESYACITSRSKLPVGEGYNHYDSIQDLKRLNKNYSFLKRKIKSMTVGELVEMCSILHKKSNNNWTISERLIS